MTREFFSYPVQDFDSFKVQLLNYLGTFGIACFLDNHRYEFDRSFECLAGAGVREDFSFTETAAPEALDAFTSRRDWIFGHVAYDFPDRWSTGAPPQPDPVGFPDCYFFIPETVFILDEHAVRIGVGGGAPEAARIYETVRSVQAPPLPETRLPATWRSRFTRQEYLETVELLRGHIRRGDCYEINFCQEFFLEGAVIDPLATYRRLSRLSPHPFAAWYRIGDRYVACASPERYLKKNGSTIFSQPMKGTIGRDREDAVADRALRDRLLSDEKERAENIMIVDLVRNDLSRICREGSVQVTAFPAVHSFPRVHQLISTIQGTLREDCRFSEILRATFPMGSMTGAPKIRVMELIRAYERSKRGLFSGTIGYFTPQGDFDFNVVIRSILYNRSSGYVSLQAGSAITFRSDAATEYGECLTKIGAMQEALVGEQPC